MSEKTISLIAYYADKASEADSDDCWFGALLTLCEAAWNPSGSWSPVESTSLGEDTNVKLLKLAVASRKWSFFETMAIRAQGDVPLKFFCWIRKYATDNGIPFRELRKGYVVRGLDSSRLRLTLC